MLTPAVQPGTFDVPRLEHRQHRPLQLLRRGLREGLTCLPADHLLVRLHQTGQVARVQPQVVRRAHVPLQILQRLIEQGAVDAHHRAAEHLDETAVRVPGEPLVTRGLRQALHRVVVQTDVQDRLHHPGHRIARARTHRHQQRIVPLTQPPPRGPLQRGQMVRDLTRQTGRFTTGRQERAARFRGDDETGRHRQPQPGHLGQVGALAAQQVGLILAALAERVHITGHLVLLLICPTAS